MADQLDGLRLGRGPLRCRFTPERTSSKTRVCTCDRVLDQLQGIARSDGRCAVAAVTMASTYLSSSERRELHVAFAARIATCMPLLIRPRAPVQH